MDKKLLLPLVATMHLERFRLIEASDGADSGAPSMGQGEQRRLVVALGWIHAPLGESAMKAISAVSDGLFNAMEPGARNAPGVRFTILASTAAEFPEDLAPGVPLVEIASLNMTHGKTTRGEAEAMASKFASLCADLLRAAGPELADAIEWAAGGPAPLAWMRFDWAVGDDDEGDNDRWNAAMAHAACLCEAREIQKTTAGPCDARPDPLRRASL